jgi:hypothetical protein
MSLPSEQEYDYGEHQKGNHCHNSDFIKYNRLAAGLRYLIILFFDLEA